MSPILLLFFLFIGSQSSDVFSVPVGRVILQQNICSVVPHRVWKRLDQQGHKVLGDYSPETLKFLMEWARTSHGVESRIEEMILKWDEQSICFNRPTTMELRKVAHGGRFSTDMNIFSYLEIPQMWVVGNEEQLESWRNVNLEECTSSDNLLYNCPEAAFKETCSRKELIKCSKQIDLDSSNNLFTFARRLHGSHVVATRAPEGSIICNGDIFGIKSMKLPKRIFMITLNRAEMMSVGNMVLMSN